MPSLPSVMLQAARRPIQHAPLFRAGQRVRVLRFVANDGQTPDYWAGAVCTCLSRRAVGVLQKRWSYLLQHANGQIAAFQEYELDQRFTPKQDKA